jgi:hypothetical protein
MTFSDSVEALKNQYTDKYVRVNAARPELARFHDVVGQVKTVNMNGRALVQFLDYNLNTGWYDIDPGCLTIVDKPSADLTAKPEPKRAHDKPAGKAAPTAGDKQVADAAAGKKLSPLEMARMQGAAGKGGGAAAKPASGGAAPAKKSTADILAAARAGKSAPAAEAAAAPAPVAAAAPAAEPAAPVASAGGVVRIDWKSMSTADKIAYCRAKDTK